MSKRIRVGSTTYVVPDDATDDEVTELVDQRSRPGVPKPANPIEQEIKSKPLQYNEQPQSSHPMPGSFEGHPENIGEYVPATVGQAASGIGDLAQGNISRGGHEIISGVGNALLPVAPFVAAAAPMAAARAVVGGTIGGKMASGITSAAGGSEDQQALAGDVGNVVGGGVGLNAPEMAASAARKVLPKIASSVDPDITGLVSPRLAHLQRVAGKVNRVLEKPEVPTAEGTAGPPTSPAAEHLQSRIATERDLAAQPPFPNRAEGLPEVEAAQPIATQHLRNAIATKPEAAPLPSVKPAKVGDLLNQATGGKALIPNVPLKNQMDAVTPVVPRESAVVKSHSYDPQAQELTVKTQNGSEYVHGEVSPEQFKAFQSAESKGKAWNDIRNNSTLVAKIVNGKRVSIQPPNAARVADPNDLTPILKESVQQAKAKQK